LNALSPHLLPEYISNTFIFLYIYVLDKYIYEGGKALFAIDPLFDTGIESLIDGYGIESKDNFVIEEKNYREKDTDTKEFWMPILQQKSFRDFVENKYRVASGNIMETDIDQTFDVATMNGAE
jgi:hypothetical protein